MTDNEWSTQEHGPPLVDLVDHYPLEVDDAADENVDDSFHL